MHLLGRAEAAAHPVQVSPAKGRCQQAPSQDGAGLGFSCPPWKPPAPRFAQSHARASMCTRQCPQGQGVLPAPVIAGIALVPRAWELEILKEMSFSQSHGVKLGHARGKLGGQRAIPAALKVPRPPQKRNATFRALAVGGGSRFAVTWPWALHICDALETKKGRLGWSMRLLPRGQVHMETPVERTEVMGTLCALSNLCCGPAECLWRQGEREAGAGQ